MVRNSGLGIEPSRHDLYSVTAAGMNFGDRSTPRLVWELVASSLPHVSKTARRGAPPSGASAFKDSIAEWATRLIVELIKDCEDEQMTCKRLITTIVEKERRVFGV
jgi:hypothetical protein